MAAAYICLLKSQGKDHLMERDHGAPNQTQASPVLGHLLRDDLEGRNSTNSTRALKLPDGTSAAWYILIIIGIYGVIFLFRLASNILRKNDKSLEDIYYSNLTSELKKKGLQSKAAKCSSLPVSNGAVLQPNQASLGIMCGNSSPTPKSKESLESLGKQASVEKAQTSCFGEQLWI
ncbi:small integral membrane protein 34A-like [Neophocaena asiaeorientalis asiaeorientalis]|uniref:Small integral membrane protein 34A-like n=1 Tax=Neophocaena asiaeorientalis asiaeorientalis TaxID=1706337 RepID=A0A341CHM9_NEOAA|nr:small integral membrane protein 34A-like [Neophocaena asiaeorientalis asiaeorientalis]